MLKHCVICGAEFSAPPSAKTVTCSPVCRSERARRHASNGRPWSEEAKAKLAAMGQTKNLPLGKHVARFRALRYPEEFHAAKVWRVVDPQGRNRRIINLKRTLINELGDVEGRRIERVLAQMATVMRKGGDAWTTLCGWTLIDTPKSPGTRRGKE